MVIDFHTHVFPDKIAEKTVESLKARASLPAFSDGTVSGLRASMERSGVDLSVVLPVVTAPRQFQSVCAFAQSINQEGRGLLSFGGLHPQSESWEQELTELKAMGFQGIKLHPDYQDTFVDEPRMLRLLSKAAELDLIVVLHSGLDLGLPDPVHCTPQRAARMLEEVGGGRFVFAHCGASGMLEDVERHLAGRDVWFDLSFDLLRLPPERVTRLIRLHGAHRCLFATDSPWTDQEESLRRVDELGLTLEERDRILGGNGEELLGL